jgi:ribonuclease M5
MDKPTIQEAIVVEGRYDKNTLSQIVDALILETNGFQLYHNKTLRDHIRSAAERTGIIILTDSDASGFQIRSRIKAFVPENLIKNAYIPDIYGKETAGILSVRILRHTDEKCDRGSSVGVEDESGG